MNKRLSILILAALIVGACAQPAAPTAPPAPAGPTATAEVVKVDVVTVEPVETEAEPVETEVAAPSAEQVDVVLINNFMGNSWRSLMEKSIQLSLEYLPIKGRVKSLRIINTDNNPAAQNAAISTATLDKPDIILMIAASQTASNQAIQEACDAGIIVISFDSTATAECGWRLEIDWKEQGHAWSKWLANTIGGKGIIFQDLGMQGASPAVMYAEGAAEVLAEYPDIEVFTYWSNFSPGEEEAQVATLIAAHPKVDGLLTDASGNFGNEAIKKAGAPYVPCTGFAISEGMIWCNETGTPCLLHSSPPFISIEALKLGLKIFDGEIQGPARWIVLDAPYFVNNDVPVETTSPVYKIADYVEGLGPGMMAPLTPPDMLFPLEELMKPPILE